MTPSQRNNSAFVGAGLAYDTREAEMAAFEALPEPLRRIVDQQATKLSAATVLRHLGWALDNFGTIERAIAATAKKLAALEEGEIGVMAGRYRGETKLPYPHIAAQATIVRYGALGAARRPNRVRVRGMDRLQVPTVTA